MQLEGGEESGEIDQMLLPCALQCHIVYWPAAAARAKGATYDGHADVNIA